MNRWKKTIILSFFIGITLLGGYSSVDSTNKYIQARCSYRYIREDYLKDIRNLKGINNDITGWIKIKGSDIDYPILKSTNNIDYLHTLPTGEINPCGSIFIDFRCEKPFETFNTIIYGHNMKDGSMFGPLKNIKNGVIEVITTKGIYRYDIVINTLVDCNSIIYNRINYDNSLEEEFNMVKKDKYITLSTCAYEFEGARRIVIGKLL
jgi:sortase B